MSEADGSGERAIPEGSYAAGRKVKLPAGAERPIAVFVNGVRQVEGEDFGIEGETVVFSRPILKEEPVGLVRWTIMLIGLWGTYRTHETVDVEYRLDGSPRFASDLPVGD